MICLTFDVEERFHSHLVPGGAPREWTAGDALARVVDALEAAGRKATFFVVGELADRYPGLMRRIGDAGFEIASHSHTHLKMDAANRAACMKDITRSVRTLEDVTGREVIGYRSPTWTAQRDDEWLWDHLIELGLTYDSSLFPFRTHLYGSFENPTRPFQLRPELTEIPPSVASFGPVRVPYGGGFYFRLYPAWLTRQLIEREQRRGHTPVVYLHPWELAEGDRETLERGLLNRFIGTINDQQTWPRFRELLGRYETCTMRDQLAGLAARGDG